MNRYILIYVGWGDETYKEFDNLSDMEDFLSTKVSEGGDLNEYIAIKGKKLNLKYSVDVSEY